MQCNRNFGAPHFPPVEFCACRARERKRKRGCARAFKDIYDLRLVRRIDLRTPVDAGVSIGFALRKTDGPVSYSSDFTLENSAYRACQDKLKKKKIKLRTVLYVKKERN